MFHRRDADTPAVADTLRFGPFVLNLQQGTLLRDGQTVAVPRRPFELLCYLARHAGRVVPAHELLDAVWGHQHLSSSSLKATVNNLRRALGEDGKSARWIASVARRGYRFVADDEAAAVAMPPPSAAVAQPLADLDRTQASSPAPIGRAAELAQLQQMLAAHRLVTITGSAGIGKTHLAIAALPLLTQACADGAWLLRLDSVTDADTLVTSLAHTLRLAPDAGRDSAALADALRTLSVGLLLDNGEHLAAVLAPLLAQWLAAAPGLRVLCTSQQALGLAGEQLLTLGPLSLPPVVDNVAGSASAEHAQISGLGRIAHSGAAALLIACLRQRDPTFEPDAAQCQHIAAICRALDGVPLELELAAARVPLLGLAGVQARLHERLDMLRQHSPPAAEASTRHHSLRAALGWSHALLPPQHQQVLHRLSVFEGSFSASAAEAVLTDEKLVSWDVLDAIAALAERSLLTPAGSAPAAGTQRRRNSHAEAGEHAPASAQQPRWRLLHGIRAFAAEQLAHSGDSARLQQAHALWLQRLLAESGPQLHEMASHEWLARLEPELDNLRAALRHAQRKDTHLALQLWARSVGFWVRAGLKHEALRWQRALDATPGELAAELPTELQAELGQAQAVLCVLGMAGSPQEARRAAELAHQHHSAQGDVMAAYYDLYLLAMILVRLQQPLPASGLLAQMRALEQPGWNRAQRRYARWIAAVQQRQAGDTDGYHQAMREEQAFARQLGDRSTLWSTSYALALADHERGDAEQAIAQLGQVWQDIAAAGALRSQPGIVGMHAAMLLWHGASSAALPQVQQAVALLRADRNLWTLASALPWRAWWEGRPADAARLLGWADAQIVAAGERRGPFYGRLNAALEAALHSALAAAEEARLRDEGALLSEPDALALVFRDSP